MQRPRSILVVDDDPTILEFLAICLDDEGYSVRTAIDGVDALQTLSGWHPELILLDLQMPRLDGRGFLAAQRADARLAPIPVMLMSATVNLAPDLLEQVAAFLPKPFGIAQLLDQVERLVGLLVEQTA